MSVSRLLSIGGIDEADHGAAFEFANREGLMPRLQSVAGIAAKAGEEMRDEQTGAITKPAQDCRDAIVFLLDALGIFQAIEDANQERGARLSA